MAMVYKFQTWVATDDEFYVSRRLATKEAIARVHAEPISEGIEVDDKFIGYEIPGMTARDFNPQDPPSEEFQTQVRR